MRLRRAYYDCRYGQLHLHNAIPPGGGFDELTSLICLHDSGETAKIFKPWLEVLGARRSVYALDLPGSGESDPAAEADAVQAAIHAVTDFVVSCRIRQFDLVARGAATHAARQLLASQQAGLRRVVLVGSSETLPNGRNVMGLPDLHSEPTAGLEQVRAFLEA